MITTRHISRQATHPTPEIGWLYELAGGTYTGNADQKASASGWLTTAQQILGRPPESDELIPLLVLKARRGPERAAQWLQEWATS